MNNENKAIIVVIIIIRCFSGLVQELLLYANKNVNIFIGSLTANQFLTKWNRFGGFGNEFSRNSIWNKVRTCGNLLYMALGINIRNILQLLP